MSRKDTVFLVVPSLTIGGQERQALLTEKCLREEYNVKLIVFHQAGNSYSTSTPVINLGLSSLKGNANKAFQQLCRASALRRLRKCEKPVAVYSFGTTANLTNVLSIGIGKTIVSIRNYPHVNKGFVNRRIYKNADAITCQTKAMLDALTHNHPYTALKCCTIYNGYDIEEIHKQANEPIELQPDVVAIGRLCDQKGFRHLLWAFSLVVKKKPDTKLYVLGTGQLEGELTQLIEMLHLQNNVMLYGYSANPYAILRKCKLFVLSSIHEGFPNVLAEAMVCGAPVIAADCKSGPREILSESYTDKIAEDIVYKEYGILVPPFISDTSDEPEKEAILAEAIIRMLSDDGLREHYAQKGKERAKTFSMETYREKIIEIIDNGCKN